MALKYSIIWFHLCCQLSLLVLLITGITLQLIHCTAHYLWIASASQLWIDFLLFLYYIHANFPRSRLISRFLYIIFFLFFLFSYLLLSLIRFLLLSHILHYALDNSLVLHISPRLRIKSSVAKLSEEFEIDAMQSVS